MMTERTFSIIKPDAVKRNLIGAILTRFEQNGFKIESLLPRELELNTKNGSLLYRRESQNVGREIIKIVKK